MNRDWYIHTVHRYVGWLDGVTHMKKLFEQPTDSEGQRVCLPDGSVRVASKPMLLRLDTKEAVLKAHQWRLEQLGIEYRGVKLANGKNETLITGCWQCKSTVASWVNHKCLKCNRLVCECSACLCGWTGSVSKESK